MTKGIKNLRLKKYDYKTDGYYFITICSNNQKNFTEQEKHIISEYIKNIKNVETNTHVDYYQLTKNHLHMILVLEDSQRKLGELIRRFKARVSTHLGKKLWQPNYYEHIIRTGKALERIREYIKNNPLKEQIDFGEIYSEHSS